MKNANLLFMLAVVALSGTAALDQATAQWGYGSRGWGDNRASTAEEGIMRGMSDLTRARGAQNMMNAEAAKTMTDVRSAELENRVQYTETYWERKRINRENRFPSAEEKSAIRQQNLEKQMFHRARVAQGTRPGAGTLDPVSGGISWPMTLQNPTYNKYREDLEALFSERADKQGAIGFEAYTQITSLTDSWLKQLRKDLRKSGLGQREYMDSKRFIESLAVEARHTT